MKKILSILSIAVLVISFSITAFAHSGRTDKNGGHNDNIHGGYHYHCGGYPAHQHPNGVCPYDTNAKAKSESEERTTKKLTTKATEKLTTEATTETTTEQTTETAAAFITDTETSTYATINSETDKSSKLSAGETVLGISIFTFIAGAIVFIIMKKK